MDGYWREMFGAIYLTEGEARNAQACLERANENKRYRIGFDCIQRLWRVYEYIAVAPHWLKR